MGSRSCDIPLWCIRSHAFPGYKPGEKNLVHPRADNKFDPIDTIMTLILICSETYRSKYLECLSGEMKSVKSADTPDSVHFGCPKRDRH